MLESPVGAALSVRYRGVVHTLIHRVCVYSVKTLPNWQVMWIS